MVKVVKSEWHQVEKVYGLVIDIDMLQEIYPDKEEQELQVILDGIEDGTYDLDDVFNDAYENDVEIEWDYLDQDDWWTDRKGGYEVTYKVEDWNHTEPYEVPKTHKCTKCRWTGPRYETKTEYYNEDGSIHTEDDLEFHHTKDVCPMCDSDLELTEVGIADKEKTDKLRQELNDIILEEDDENVGTPPSDEEMAAQLKAVEDSVKPEPDSKSAWPWAVVKSEKTDIDTETQTETLKPFPPGEYVIRIWGYTLEMGADTITEEQYEYWSDSEREYDLADALTESYDYDENETPESARFEYPYYDLTGVKSFYGYEFDNTTMTIENDKGEEVYRGELGSFIHQAHGDDDTYYDAEEEVEEFYPEYLGKGYFVVWKQGGKGSCFRGTLNTTTEFDPRKLKVITWDCDGISHVHHIEYDGEHLDDEGMDSEHDNWRGKWAEYKVHYNEK